MFEHKGISRINIEDILMALNHWPRWAEGAARHLPNSLHVVVPGAYGVGGKCITGCSWRTS
jgi:hypothetical protein